MRNSRISKRGMAHILEMYALDEGLKVLQKTGGVKDESNKRQRKEKQQRTSEPLCCGLFVVPIVVCHPKSGTPPGSAISKGFLVSMYGLHPNAATPFWSACTPGKCPIPPGNQNGKRSQMGHLG